MKVKVTVDRKQMDEAITDHVTNNVRPGYSMELEVVDITYGFDKQGEENCEVILDIKKEERE